MLQLMFTDAENRGWANDFAVDGPDGLGGTLCDPGGERAYGRPFVTAGIEGGGGEANIGWANQKALLECVRGWLPEGAKVDVARRSILSLGGVVRVVAEEGLAVSVTPERQPQCRRWTCQGLAYRGGPHRPIQSCPGWRLPPTRPSAGHRWCRHNLRPPRANDTLAWISTEAKPPNVLVG
jgi:hypothetical protein